MRKAILSFLLFVFSLNCLAQSTDTIHLKEIKVQGNSKKVKHIKTKGKSSSLSGNPIQSMISRMDDIPAGALASIKFHFNSSSAFFIADSNKKNYKDVEMGLLIYEGNEDGTPGKPITDKEIRFTIKADHRGDFELDLTPLYLNTRQSMYFGIALFNKQEGTDFKIMIDCDKSPTHFYLKSWNRPDWFPFDFRNDANCGLKMDLGIKPTQ